MNSRRRGQATKERILEEACRVFAEKGYRGATHAEICRRSKTNVAAINYYFDSKESLYRATFEHLAERAETLYPLSGDLPESAPPEQRLRAFIHAHLSRVFDPERLGNFHRICMAEIYDPTGILTEALDRRLARNRGRILPLLRELLGPEVSLRVVEWCELSVVSQCLMGLPGGRDRGAPDVFGLGARDVEALAEHIFEFCLAGIEAVRRRRRAFIPENALAEAGIKE